MFIRNFYFFKVSSFIRSPLLSGALLFLFILIPSLSFSADDPAPKTKKISQNFYQQGRDFISEGKWLNAIQSFRKAVQQDKKDYKAHNMLGYSLRQSGKITEAIGAYNSSLALKPNYEEALEYRAVTYAKLGMIEKAMHDYKKLLSLESSLSDGLKEKILKSLGK